MTRTDRVFALIRLVLVVAVSTCMLFVVISAAAALSPETAVYLPLVRSAPVRVTGTVYPPNGLHCLLQQGTSRVIDPRTDAEVFNCEDAHGHGQVVWTGQTQLLDHVADGSGSLSVTDGIVYITVVRDDGGVQIETVPTP